MEQDFIDSFMADLHRVVCGPGVHFGSCPNPLADQVMNRPSTLEWAKRLYADLTAAQAKWGLMNVVEYGQQRYEKGCADTLKEPTPVAVRASALSEAIAVVLTLDWGWYDSTKQEVTISRDETLAALTELKEMG
jgi:hypothetical protein